MMQIASLRFNLKVDLFVFRPATMSQTFLFQVYMIQIQFENYWKEDEIKCAKLVPKKTCDRRLNEEKQTRKALSSFLSLFRFPLFRFPLSRFLSLSLSLSLSFFPSFWTKRRGLGALFIYLFLSFFFLLFKINHKLQK